jgi:hypothetical protein
VTVGLSDSHRRKWELRTVAAGPLWSNPTRREAGRMLPVPVLRGTRGCALRRPGVVRTADTENGAMWLPRPRSAIHANTTDAGRQRLCCRQRAGSQGSVSPVEIQH